MLENGMQWIGNAVSHRDMQFTELRTVSRDACLEAAGMPGSMIGVSEHVNKANAQTGEVTFARWIVKERLERRKQALNNDFLPRFGATADGLEFDYLDPTPTDDAAETQATLVRFQSWQIGVDGGLASEEVLQTVGLPAMTWTKPDKPAPTIHFGTPPGNDPTTPEGQPNEDADAKEMANA
jgi:phage portal protein BeeE